MGPQKSTDSEDSKRVDNSEEQLKEISLRYGNLIDKVSLRVKNSKGKTKLCIKWVGDLKELKEFVSLVFKKSGNWSEGKNK